jgi:glucose-6-phosphate-specific signal transduction histidine kinase
MDAAEPGAPKRRAIRSDTLLDHGLSRVYRELFVRHRALSFPLFLAAYAALFYFLGDRLGVSANYFVILPVLVSALCFGTVGGIVGGLLGLPANLALFALIGHLEYSPESKPIAEVSGILVGFAFGYLADFFKKLEAEIRRRRAAELRLVLALEEKELLLRELHHRVKNNLTIIKSLVQLQRNRSSDPEFLESTDQLIGRIFSISLVHDLLYRHDKPLSMDLEDYLRGIATNVVAGCPAVR